MPPAAARSLRAVADPTGTTPDPPAAAGDAAGVTAVPEAADTTPETETETAAAEEADAGPAVVVAPPGSAAGMELVFVDPATLVVAANVRGELDLDAEFLASIRDLGVLSPIKARRAADGSLRVLFGHRRAVAAAEVGRPVVPVVVVDAPDDAKAAEILRVVEQVVENTRRSGISEADEVRAHQELLDLGLTAAQVARATHTPRGRVKATAQVAASSVALEVMDRYQLDLAAASGLAEVDDDPAAVETLVGVLDQDPAQFGHALQRVRDERTLTAERDGLAAGLAEAGVRILGDPDRALIRAGTRRLRMLRPTPQDSPGTELTPEAHAGCPGHAAYVQENSPWAKVRVEAVYVCTDWQTHGHGDRYTRTGLPTPTPAPAGGPMSEGQKAQRRTVIANNKAWESARTVRRDWLRGFVARRTPPKDAQRWIATTLATAGGDVRRGMESGHSLAADLLGLVPAEQSRGGYLGAGRRAITEAAARATAGRAAMLTLGMLLAGREEAVVRAGWRNPSPEVRAYFTALRGWGYPLSDVEHLVLGDTGTPSERGGDPGETSSSADGADTDGEDPDPERAAEVVPDGE